MNPFQWLWSQFVAVWDAFWLSVSAFFTWLTAWLSNLFNPAPYLTWLVDVLPAADPRVVGLLDDARVFLQSSAAAIQVMNLALDLPALGVVLGVIALTELALVFLWLWRGLLSIVPFAG